MSEEKGELGDWDNLMSFFSWANYGGKMYEFENIFRLLHSAHPRLDPSSCPQTSCQSSKSQLTATSSIQSFVIKVILDSSFSPTPYSFSQENLFALPDWKTYIDPTTCHHLHHPILASIFSYQNYCLNRLNLLPSFPHPQQCVLIMTARVILFNVILDMALLCSKPPISFTPKTKSHFNGLQGPIWYGLCPHPHPPPPASHWAPDTLVASYCFWTSQGGLCLSTVSSLCLKCLFLKYLHG